MDVTETNKLYSIFAYLGHVKNTDSSNGEKSSSNETSFGKSNHYMRMTVQRACVHAYVIAYVHIHVCMHTYIHTYIPSHIHT